MINEGKKGLYYTYIQQIREFEDIQKYQLNNQ